MTKTRVLSRFTFAIAPLGLLPLFAEGSARADEAPADLLFQGEPLVTVDTCPFDPRHPHAMRCLSKQMVPQSYARARQIGPFTPPPDAGAGVDASADIAKCDGKPNNGFGLGASGLGPSDYIKAYSIPATPTGAGKVVAIVDACANTTVVSDLAAYRANYGLPALPECGGAAGHAPVPGGTPCFGVVSQRGDGALPTRDSGWAGEIALDVDMVSAACPDCSILLVEADSPNGWDLGPAVDEAVALGASAVSNSYGSLEDPNDPYGVNYSDGPYVKHYQHDGVLITVASGDWSYDNQGYPNGPPPYYAPSFPSTIPNVLSIGGTNLTATGGTGRGYSETVWNGTSSGCSIEFAKPAYQTGVSMGSCAMRADTDVAAPASGVAAYSGGAWAPGGFSGTSCAAPFIAGLFTRIGLASQPNAFFYAHPSAFYDVTSGNNEGSITCPDNMCKAAAGWDGPTGWGTPNATALLATEADAGAGGPDAGHGADAGVDAGHGPDAGGTDAGQGRDATTDATTGSDASGGTDATLGSDAGDDSGSSSGGSGSSSGGSGSSSGGSGSSSGGSGSSSGGSGSSSGGSSSGGGTDDGGPIAPPLDGSAGDDGGGNGAAGDSNGCGCTTVGSSTAPEVPGGLALIGLGMLVGARRRRRG